MQNDSTRQTDTAARTDNGTTLGSGSPAMLDKYVKLYHENNDLAGWLSIEGMKIDYPVLQNADNEYYLHRDFYGKDSKYGCLYVKNHADLQTGTNFVIYGHNMKDGSMFGDLYQEEFDDFYSNIKALSLYDTGVEAQFGDTFLTLSTCAYHVQDGRFVVVARRTSGL